MTNTPQASTRQVVVAALASVAGWSFDLFDLFILLFVAPTLAVVFFPSHIPTLSLAAVYASFAVTLLMRPIGSAIFGTYADKRGRRNALIVAVSGVGISTFLMGLLPTFVQVGLIAPGLFVVLRLIQGVFVGGVVASTHTIGTETVSPKWRGLVSGLVAGAGGFGALFASIAFYIISAIFPGQSFSVWGWRFMFFTGILGAILSYLVFRAVQESPLWVRAEQQRKVARENPLRVLFSGKYRRVFLINVLTVAAIGTEYYLTIGYLPTFLSIINGVSKATSGTILIVGSLIVVAAAALFGHISEMIGRKKTFIAIGAADLVLVPLAYWQLAQLKGDSFGLVVLYTLALFFLGNLAYAPLPIFLNERFPTAIRASGTGLSWNTGSAIGGIMPTFVTALAGKVANIPQTLIIFLVCANAVILLGTFLVSETRGKVE